MKMCIDPPSVAVVLKSVLTPASGLHFIAENFLTIKNSDTGIVNF